MHLGCGHLDVSCSREVFAILVERDCHNTVSSVKGLLHPIAMVNVNVNVQHSLVVSERKGGRRKMKARSKWGTKVMDALGGKLLPHTQRAKIVNYIYMAS